MSYDADDKFQKMLVKLGATIAVVLVQGVYHHFATNTQDIANARLDDKEEKVHYDCSGSGKNRHCHWEHDYYLYTSKGVIHDEASLWDGKFADGQIYKKVEKGNTYDFKVNHDNIFNSNNALEYTAAAPVNAPSYNRELETVTPKKEPVFA